MSLNDNIFKNYNLEFNSQFKMIQENINKIFTTDNTDIIEKITTNYNYMMSNIIYDDKSIGCVYYIPTSDYVKIISGKSDLSININIKQSIEEIINKISTVTAATETVPTAETAETAATETVPTAETAPVVPETAPVVPETAPVVPETAPASETVPIVTKTTISPSLIDKKIYTFDQMSDNIKYVINNYIKSKLNFNDSLIKDSISEKFNIQSNTSSINLDSIKSEGEDVTTDIQIKNIYNFILYDTKIRYYKKLFLNTTDKELLSLYINDYIINLNKSADYYSKLILTKPNIAYISPDDILANTLDINITFYINHSYNLNQEAPSKAVDIFVNMYKKYLLIELIDILVKKRISVSSKPDSFMTIINDSLLGKNINKNFMYQQIIQNNNINLELLPLFDINALDIINEIIKIIDQISDNNIKLKETMENDNIKNKANIINVLLNNSLKMNKIKYVFLSQLYESIKTNIVNDLPDNTYNLFLLSSSKLDDFKAYYNYLMSFYKDNKDEKVLDTDMFSINEKKILDSLPNEI